MKSDELIELINYMCENWNRMIDEITLATL